MDLIKSLWRGDVPLVKTYWLYGFFGWNLLGAALAVLEQSFPSPLPLSGAFILLLVSFFALAYWVLTIVAIWRSASKYKGNSLWALLARLAVVIGVFVALAVMVEVFKGE
jgi:hypothetical protein